MKILFISPCLPLEYGSGSAIRSYQLYKQLTALADVDVLTATNWPIEQAFKEDFQGTYIGHIKIPVRSSILKNPGPLSQQLSSLVDLNQYDFVFVRYFNQAYWLGLFELDKLILDCDDCMLEILENEFHDTKRNSLSRLRSYISYRVFKTRYLKTLQRARSLIYARHSKYSVTLPNAYVIPNRLSPSTARSHQSIDNSTDKNISVLFVGILNYAPNIDGVDHFLSRIWPAILKKHPDTIFTIVGARAKSRTKRRWQKHPNTIVQGYVRDIEEAYQQADISVVPVYRGGGAHVKVMETLKYAKPVVLSDESQRGYRNKIIDGENAFVALNDQEFIEKLSRLIDNHNLRKTIASNGNELFHQYFSIDAEDPTMRKLLLNQPQTHEVQTK